MSLLVLCASDLSILPSIISGFASSALDLYAYVLGPVCNPSVYISKGAAFPRVLDIRL